MTLTRPQRLVLRALILAPLVYWAASNWWRLGAQMRHLYVDVPMMDYWRVVQDYPSYSTGDFKVFWQPHNEHRILFPEIVFAIDMLVCKGRMIMPLIASYLAYLSIWGAFLWAILRRSSAAPPFTRWAALALSALVLAWKSSEFVLATPFLFQWTLNQAAAVCAFLMLALLAETGKSRWLAATALCATVSTYSSSNGIIMWPLAIAGALLLRLPWRQLLPLASLGVLNDLLFFYRYHPDGKPNVRLILENKIYFVKFLASFFSMPFSVQKEPEFGVHVGLWAFTALAAAALLTWRRGLLRTPVFITAAGSAAFCILSAAMAALGRMNPADPYLIAPRATRYLTLPLMFWATLAFLCIWSASHLIRSADEWVPLALTVVLAFMLFRLGEKGRFNFWRIQEENFFADQHWSALAMESGVHDPVPCLKMFPDMGFEAWFPTLRDKHLAYFAEPRVYWIGKDWKSIFTLKPSTLTGGIAASKKYTVGVGLLGYVKTRAHPEVILVDEANRIVGLGKEIRIGTPNAFPPPDTSLGRPWYAFINLAYHSHTVVPYLVDQKDKTAQPLAASYAIP